MIQSSALYFEHQLQKQIKLFWCRNHTQWYFFVIIQTHCKMFKFENESIIKSEYKAALTSSFENGP